MIIMANNNAQTVVQTIKMSEMKRRSNWSYCCHHQHHHRYRKLTTAYSSSTLSSIFSLIIINNFMMLMIIITMLPLPNSCSILLNTEAGMFVCLFIPSFTHLFHFVTMIHDILSCSHIKF